MSLNSSAVQPPTTPQQQNTGMPAALVSGTSGLANHSEPEPTEPTLLNHAPTNSLVEIVGYVNQPPIPIAEHSAPEKSDRSTSASSEAESATTDDEITSLKKAAEQGNAQAQYKLGVCYYEGDGVEVNKEEAVLWFQRAAENGNPEAQIDLGHIYLKGVRVQRDQAMALKWIQRAAEKGHAEAEFTLGIMYDEGGGIEVDKAEAVKWYQRAAEKGHAEAQFNLGIMYEEGDGIEVNKAKAAKWYREVAEQGDKEAQYALAKMYTNGEGVEKNSEKAFRWCHKAADQNHHKAMKSLSNFYKDGHGVAKNLLLATYWMMKFLVSHGGERIAFNGESELFEFIPNILENYLEFKNVKSLLFTLKKTSSLENIARINKIIRSNTKIDHIEFFYLKELDEGSITAIAEALKFNTNLTELKFFSDKLPKETAAQIELLLTRNRDIADLRKYVADLHIETTPGFPLDIVKLMVDKMIVAFLKDGQTKEATKIAIDEMFITAGIKVLESDTQIN